MLNYILYSPLPISGKTFMQVFAESFSIWETIIEQLNWVQDPVILVIVLWPTFAIMYTMLYFTMLIVYGLWIISAMCTPGTSDAGSMYQVVLGVVVWAVSACAAHMVIFTIGEKIDNALGIDAFHRLNSTIFVAGCATMAYQAAKHTFGFNLKSKGV